MMCTRSSKITNPGAFAPGFAGYMLAYERTECLYIHATLRDVSRKNFNTSCVYLYLGFGSTLEMTSAAAT
jgi:hypothetical protein